MTRRPRSKMSIYTEIVMNDPRPRAVRRDEARAMVKGYRPAVANGKTIVSRSGFGKYRGHIGKKQIGKYVGMPEGPMHVTGHQRRKALLAWIAEQGSSRGTVAK